MSGAASRNVWILGGTSAIAQAYARRLAERGAGLVLVGRNEEKLQANAADLSARGGEASVETTDLIAADFDSVAAGLFERHGQPDEVVVAYGLLGTQPQAVADLGHAREIIDANFTSTALWLLAIRARLDPKRPATIVVLSSVAGDRGRRANFVYGAAKGGLDRFVEGLQHAHARTPLHLVLVKPGFVDTPMTAHQKKDGPLWATPERIAREMERAVERRRFVVRTPWFWMPIMLVIRNLPRFLFHRLKI